MANFSIVPWFAIALEMLIPLGLVAGIALLVARSRRQRPDVRPVEQRLAQQDALHARGVIDADEHARERSRVLRELWKTCSDALQHGEKPVANLSHIAT